MQQINYGYPCSLARSRLVDLRSRHLFKRVKIKTLLERETRNERLVNVASWRGFSKLAYKIYSFADLAIGG